MKKVMLLCLALMFLLGCTGSELGTVQAPEVEITVPDVGVGVAAGAVLVEAQRVPAVSDAAQALGTLPACATGTGLLVASSASLVMQPGLVQDMIEGPRTYAVEAPPLDQVEPCDHASEKHALEATRGVMAIRHCGTGLEIMYSALSKTWLYICPDSQRIQCAVMFVRNCPIPHNGCYPMATVYVTMCTYVYNTIVQRDGFGSYGAGADILLASVAAGAGEVVVEQ